MSPDPIFAIVVTYNRRELLGEALRALEAQTRPLDAIVVVDNASTDGTAEMVREGWPAVHLLRLDENAGATGGYWAGMQEAVARGASWLWCLDDDAIAKPDALERLLDGLARAPGPRPPVLLASRVEWRDGRAHPANQPMVRRRDVPGLVAAVEAGLVPMRAGSWIAMMISREALERHGPPIEAFFYQTDDIEHTARMLRTETGYVVPDSVVEHRTPTPHSTLTDADPLRFYHHLRNTLFMLRGPSWEGYEKPVWGWVLLESSARFLVKHRFSPESLATIGRAIRDGLGPLPTPGP